MASTSSPNESETTIFRKAVEQWWAVKNAPRKKKAKKQGGTRDKVVGGKHLNGFADTVTAFLISLGVNKNDIYTGGQLAKKPALLPSYYRPSKAWDLIVVGSSRFHSPVAISARQAGQEIHPSLYVAIEFKSQDKSIGNNQNNRLEESLGNALDFWTTYESSGFAKVSPRPWLGYLFIGKYAAGDKKQVKIRQPHFLTNAVFRGDDSAYREEESFKGPTYAERYQLFLRQAVAKRLYDAGSFLITDETLIGKKLNYSIPIPEFGPGNFMRSLKAHIEAHYPIKKG